MSIIVGAQTGRVCRQVNGATDSRAPIAFGTPANAVVTSTAQTVTLPVDPSGNSYPSYLIWAAGNIWYAWTTGSGNASPAGANCYLQSNSNSTPIIPPVNATSISVILDATSGAGSICIVGIY